MRVLVAMSGGVDSSVAAARCLQAGHETVGVTLKLWGGPADQGCCSVSDVDDARRVADQLGIDHHVFNYRDQFDAAVVEPYVAAHLAGRTPNPCIECNRHLKFDALYRRARALGFDAVATGHHAQARPPRGGGPGAGWRLARGADGAKDQSYVLWMLGQEVLARTLFPVGELRKEEVRALAAALGLRTAAKPDSQDVCFIGAGAGRRGFLAERAELTPGRLVDLDGRDLGPVPAMEMVTIGQRKGLGLSGGPGPRYVVDINRDASIVTVGPPTLLLRRRQALVDAAWAEDGLAPGPADGPRAVLAQCSAHGPALAARVVGDELEWSEPQRRVAPGQSVVFYDPARPEEVLGGAVAC